MAIHNRTNPHVGVSHPDNYGAYVTDDATGKITWRNTGQGGGREGGHANVHGGAASSGYKEFRGEGEGNSKTDKKPISSKNLNTLITDFFSNFRQQNLRSTVPAGAEVPKRTRGKITDNRVNDTHERRVKLSLPDGLRRFYNADNGEEAGLLKPLIESRGIIFPYTPQIIMNNTAVYNSRSPVHTNYPFQMYSNSQVSTINLLVQFTAQNAEEARYVLACITFLRLVTKSFRNNDPDAGSPPPVLRLSGHGKNLIPRVPVVVQDFALTLPNNVDYITIDDNPLHDTDRSFALRAMDRAGKEMAVDRVPTVTDISVTMMPVYSRMQLADYDVRDIVSGGLLGNPEGFL
jgi:hypothetical protein